MLKTIEWTEDGVRMIDQTRLPAEEVYRTCHDYGEVAEAIRSMVIRGAPAIGVAAAMGVALGVKHSSARTVHELRAEFEIIAETISKTRPTAVNLFWAVKRMREVFESSLRADADASEAEKIARAKARLVEEAQRILAEDIAVNEAIGRHGAALLKDSGTILTHCNAGALATGGYGTAVGVTHLAGVPIAPEDVQARHPAFDVTPHRYVTAIITERGIAREPYTESLKALFSTAASRASPTPRV